MRKRTNGRRSGDAVKLPSVGHNALRAHILEYLTQRGVFAWSNNTGAYHPDGDKSRFVRFGRKGSADILGVLPGGRFLSVEVKAGRDKPRPDQIEWMERINAAGGLAVVARCLEDVEQVIEGGRSDQ